MDYAWFFGLPDAAMPAKTVTTRSHGISAAESPAKEEIFEQLRESYISGITFSGGDPFHMQNRGEVCELIREIREKFPEKTIWLYTGYMWEEVKDLPNVELIDVLVDGKFVEELKDANLHWKGSSNQRVIDVKKTFASGDVILHD